MIPIIQSQTLKRICGCGLFAAALLSSAVASCAQSRPAPPASSAISVQTELVVLPVSVTDAKGNAVLGLQQQDFHVYEDGRLQKIAMFQQGDTPITVGLIVDHSRSMGEELPEVADCGFVVSRNRAIRAMRCSSWISTTTFRWNF